MAAITIDKDYGYVVLSALSTFVLNTLHSINTGALRKASATPYPLCYNSTPQSMQPGTPAYRFNCAQRAHQNYTENHTSFLGLLLLSGLVYPKTAAAAGAGWTICRWLYMKGYSEGTEGGRGRYKGVLFNGFQAGLAILTGWVGVKLVMGL